MTAADTHQARKGDPSVADCNARFPHCCNRKKINSPGKTMQAASFPFPFSLIHGFQWRRRRRRKQQLKKGVFYFSLCQKLFRVIKSKWKTTLLGKLFSTSCEQFSRPSSCLIMSPCDPSRNIRLPIKERVRNLDGTFGGGGGRICRQYFFPGSVSGERCGIKMKFWVGAISSLLASRLLRSGAHISCRQYDIRQCKGISKGMYSSFSTSTFFSEKRRKKSWYPIFERILH